MDFSLSDNPVMMMMKNIGPIIFLEEVIDRSTPVNNSLLTGSLYNVGACTHGGVLAWESWSNRTNSKPKAYDTGAPGAGAKLLTPRNWKRASERSD